jgi:hypothetical protein
MQLIDAPQTRINSLMANDLASALDPVVFARRAGINPDPWQADVLRSDADRMLLNCARQTGKSSTTALLALHRAMFVPESLVLIVSPSLRQSAEFFRKLAAVFRRLGSPIPPKAESALRVELSNDSRVISLPASEATIRGYSAVDLLLIDEASRVEDPLYQSVRPMLATSGGRLVAMSTPWGRRGWWHAAWTSTDPWHRIEVKASDCPRISPIFLEEERRNIGQWFYQQEYECEFLDAETAAFRSEDIERAFKQDIEQW